MTERKPTGTVEWIDMPDAEGRLTPQRVLWHHGLPWSHPLTVSEQVAARFGIPSTTTKPYVATPTSTTVTVRPGFLRRLFGQYVEVATIKGGCDAGLHDVYVGTTGRQGYVNWLYCRRRGCSWTAIEKGRVDA